jgi:hypothetical protein
MIAVIKGKPGVGENWKLKKTGPAPLTECYKADNLLQIKKHDLVEKTHQEMTVMS